MKKINVKPTIVNFILDKSGSMSSVVSATISGFNEYIKTLKGDTNDYMFTLTLFDTNVSQPVKNVDIMDVEELTESSYRPDGMTALYDAVCKTIKEVNPAKGQKVLNIILTDGQENSSREYTEKDMKALIEDRTKQGNWTFVYLGANQDSYAVAQKYGIHQGNISNFNATARGTTNVFAMSAMNTSSFADMDVSNTSAFYSAEDKKDLEDTK